jgi:hypothetical protein
MKVIQNRPNNPFILIEGSRRSVLPELKEIKDFSRQIQKKAKEQFGMNFKFLITWGAAIGGIMMPLEAFLDTGGFNVNEVEKLLILIGVGAIIFTENEDKIKKLVSMIEEKGLMNTFVQVLSKGEDLRKTFISFIDSLNITLQTLTNILGYAFLIPVLPMLLEFANSGYSEKDMKEILIRFAYFTSVSISGIALKEVVAKIIKRFKR